MDHTHMTFFKTPDGRQLAIRHTNQEVEIAISNRNLDIETTTFFSVKDEGTLRIMAHYLLGGAEGWMTPKLTKA